MYLPPWMKKFKEPRTEIKHIKGGYYKYQVSYKYNPLKKRTDKITGVLLGKITEEDGFIPSDKNTLRQETQTTAVDIKGYGLYYLFFDLIREEFEKLCAFFSKSECELLFAFAMFRWAYNTPIKRAPYYYLHDFCSEEFTDKKTTDKNVSNLLKTIGENRAKTVAWMKTLLEGQQRSDKEEFVMMDSTHVISKSDLLTVNARGYNADFDYDEQIRLMYLFSAENRHPVYYRLINGNITDVKSMSLCLAEMQVQNVIFISDKGFYSKDNVKVMKDMGLQYIIPLRRDNSLINYQPLLKKSFKLGLSYFLYQKRVIWYYVYRKEGFNLMTFLDESLRSKEESDYIDRMDRLPEKYTQEKFEKRLSSFGTLTFSFDIRTEKTPQEIYQAYKQRNEIEIVFDAYKNFLGADVMYMQNRYVLEGWLMANFIAMIAYHKLFARMRLVKKLDKHSPKDIIEQSKSIYMLKMNGEWNISETTKKTHDLFKLLGIDYLSQRS